ncbi:MAG: hypothetical protein IKO80_00210 [Lachnospiraceae bacterium]|nr:hypothetical protein [Lachnospiraceae bacterium]
MLIDFSRMSYLNTGTIIMDCAAVFLLVGMIVHTSYYRRRGSAADRIFYGMLIVDIIAALADGLNFSLERSPHPAAAGLIIAGDTVFTMAFETLCFMLVLFLDVRAYGFSQERRRKWNLYALPFVITIPVILGNVFFGYLFTIEPGTIYQYGGYYNLIFVAPAIYTVLAVILIARIDRHLVPMFLLMLIVRVYGGNFARGISSTPVVFAVGLAYVHIHMMNHTFYEEEVRP